jgi:hypothetical protein
MRMPGSKRRFYEPLNYHIFVLEAIENLMIFLSELPEAEQEPSLDPFPKFSILPQELSIQI